MVDGSCYVCGKLGEAFCSRCHSVIYCGPECQRSDWKRHKAFCGKVQKPSTDNQAPAPGPGSAATEASTSGVAESASLDSARPTFTPPTSSGLPGDPAPFDVILTSEKSLSNSQRVIDVLKERGVCVIRAGADRSFRKTLKIESKLLWDAKKFGEAKKGQPVVPGSTQVKYDSRDDRVLWMTGEWMQGNERMCRALKVLDGQLTDFGWGLNQLLEEQLGVTLKQRTTGMLACYSGDVVPGARYDYHIDNPYMTAMDVPDDKRRLTLIYYINDEDWEVHRDGGALQLCLSNPRRAPRTTAEAKQYPKLTVAPACDTLVVFFAHTMYHAVLPVVGSKQRFALSTWFMCA